MPSPHERQTELGALHPRLRKAVLATHKQLIEEGHPFEIFEAYRSPKRQEFLFSQGRTAPGKIVTKASAWGSYHQYGLAADFVLRINGKWSWETTGTKAKSWERLHEVGRAHGLEPLSWELPHLQMAGLNTSQLRAGIYPKGGDSSWAENLQFSIIEWGRNAPPAPTLLDRPALDSDEISEEIGIETIDTIREGLDMDYLDSMDLTRPATPFAGSAGTTRTTQFARVQPIVDKWEGGYVDHPADPGGATNMGITLATLARWRGGPVSKAQVRALTRTEAWQIMKAFYYDIIRGDDLPLPLCAAAHNAAVLHGPSRGATFLQTAISRQGIAIEIDGAIGKETLAAVAKVDLRRVVADFFAIQEQFLRGLHHFPTFGKGWMNRLEDVRMAANALVTASPSIEVADDIPIAPDLRNDAAVLGTDLNTESLVARIEELRKMILAFSGLVGGDPARGSELTKRLSDIEIFLKEVDEQKINPVTPPLTTVNGALGETVGKLLDGRKTAIGAIGAILTQVLGTAGSTGSLPEILTPLVPFVPYAQPLLIGLAAWGALGKFDKWFKRVPS
ncbi:glycosyl hydrolase 108 family protein [Mesorhizobium sp. AaZ16]|uniref:glycosyl hydrolase 108 family protein n=1 Tax=Mesorhizobium sp. AaZ16 TaxID=3402289 RepID=UPI00374E3A7B